jgi:archaellum component FlaG (FlaF/FlaG flagellin family)
MANQILPKRTTSSGNVPTTSNLAQGEIAVNLADKKLYVRDTGSNILELTTRSVSALDDTTISSPSNGQVLKYNSSTSKWTNQADADSGDDAAVAMAIALG